MPPGEARLVAVAMVSMCPIWASATLAEGVLEEGVGVAADLRLEFLLQRSPHSGDWRCRFRGHCCPSCYYGCQVQILIVHIVRVVPVLFVARPMHPPVLFRPALLAAVAS